MTADSEWLYGGPIENNPALERLPPIKKHLQTTFVRNPFTRRPRLRNIYDEFTNAPPKHDINFKFTEVKNIVDEMATSGVVFKIPTIFKMQLDKVKEEVDGLHKVFAMDVYEVNKERFVKSKEGKP